jgi:hypothetical protein
VFEQSILYLFQNYIPLKKFNKTKTEWFITPSLYSLNGVALRDDFGSVMSPGVKHLSRFETLLNLIMKRKSSLKSATPLKFY